MARALCFAAVLATHACTVESCKSAVVRLAPGDEEVVLDGAVKRFCPNGQLASLDEYRAGVRHGRADSWHCETGKPALQRSFDNGACHGPFRRWAQDGTLLETGAFVSGWRHGLWHGTDPDWTWAGEYDRGKRSGEWVATNRSGQVLMRGHAKNGKKDGHWFWFYPDRSQKQREGTYRDCFKHGLWRTWFSNGQLAENARFADGKLESIEAWLPDGSVNPHPETPRSASPSYPRPRPAPPIDLNRYKVAPVRSSVHGQQGPCSVAPPTNPVTATYHPEEWWSDF